MVIRSMLALAIAWSFGGATSAQTAHDASPTTATGAITGVVLSDDRPARPLRRARVRLAGSETSIARAIVTNEDGTFAFERLSPDEYTITAEKDGYIRSNMATLTVGAGSGNTVGLSANVIAGQVLGDGTIALGDVSVVGSGLAVIEGGR